MFRDVMYQTNRTDLTKVWSFQDFSNSQKSQKKLMLLTGPQSLSQANLTLQLEVKHRRLELKATDELGVRICCSHISNWITDKIATGLGKDVSCTDVPTENYHFSVLLNSVLES